MLRAFYCVNQIKRHTAETYQYTGVVPALNS